MCDSSLNFGRSYGVAAAQPTRCPVFGTDNGDCGFPFFAEKQQFLPIFHKVLLKI